MQTILDPHPFLFPHRAQNHEARWPRSERLYTRRGGIIRGSEERRRRGASTAVDWSVTGGHRMRGLSIIEVPCRDERPAKQGRNPEVSSFSSCLPSPSPLLSTVREMTVYYPGGGVPANGTLIKRLTKRLSGCKSMQIAC